MSRNYQRKAPPLPEDVKLCNCAQCGKELLGESMEAWRQEQIKLYGNISNSYPSLCAGRILGRPYCKFCLRLKRKPTP